MKNKLTAVVSAILILAGILSPMSVSVAYAAAKNSFAMTSLTSVCASGVPQVSATWTGGSGTYLLERQYPWATDWETTGASNVNSLTDATWLPGYGTGVYSYRVSAGTWVTAPMQVTIIDCAATPTPTPTPAPTPTPTPTPAPSSGTPDMIVTGVTMSPSAPVSGQAVTFSATIKNQGTGPTPAGIKNGVAFLIDGVDVTWSDDNTASLSPGASMVVTANFGPNNTATWLATAGTHTLDAWVNDIARYAETNVTNNHLTRTFTVSGTVTPAPTPAPTPTPAPIVTSGLQWGAYNGDTAAAPTQMESLVGKKINLVATFSGWGDSFPSQFSTTVGSQGKTLVVFWEQFNVSLDDIINGNNDTYIKQYASQAKSYGGQVMLVPFHEMNGSWTPWCGCVGNNTPAKVVAAWKHVHDLFAGDTNVKFAWNVNSNSVPDTSANAIANYYPGDAYVDYVSVDGFNFGNPWVSFAQIFNAPLAILETYNKPIYVLSTASAQGSAKAAWITDAFTVQIQKHPKIAGWVWFNENKEANWLVNSDQNSLAAFIAAIPK